MPLYCSSGPIVIELCLVDARARLLPLLFTVKKAFAAHIRVLFSNVPIGTDICDFYHFSLLRAFVWTLQNKTTTFKLN